MSYPPNPSLIKLSSPGSFVLGMQLSFKPKELKEKTNITPQSAFQIQIMNCSLRQMEGMAVAPAVLSKSG